jgi:hypothetical protein
MRKYLAAAALGAMLIAGQAAASDSAVVNADDRLGGNAPAASLLSGNFVPMLLVAGVFAGLLAYGLSQHGAGAPASP